MEQIINTLKDTHKRKSSGIDKITHFCINHLSPAHHLIPKLIREIIKEA